MLKDSDLISRVCTATPQMKAMIENIVTGKTTCDRQDTRPMSLKTYNVSKAAAKLGICRNAVYKLVKEGLIATVKFGKHFRISEEALRNYIEGLTNMTV